MRVRIWTLGAVVFSVALVTTTAIAQSQEMTSETSAQTVDSLKKFLMTLDDDKKLRYISVFRDLNGDGKAEAIVYMLSSGWCGTGGCNTFILTPKDDSWAIVSNIRITRLPIYVLSDISNGWHSIGVGVQGRRGQPGYEAKLSFDGKTYPTNPSIPPAQRLKESPAGDEVITSTEGAKLLYDN